MLGPANTPHEGLQLLACLDRSACVVQKHAPLRAGDESPLRTAYPCNFLQVGVQMAVQESTDAGCMYSHCLSLKQNQQLL